MAVRFTGQHIYVQFIDDRAGRTLAATSTRPKGAGAEGKLAAKRRARRWTKASRKWFLIAAGRFIMARSRLWRTRRARPVSNFNP